MTVVVPFSLGSLVLFFYDHSSRHRRSTSERYAGTTAVGEVNHFSPLNYQISLVIGDAVHCHSDDRNTRRWDVACPE
jgi:hypothetical protein